MIATGAGLLHTKANAAPVSVVLPEAVLDARFLAYLVSEYPQRDAVEPANTTITGRTHHVVGDIPVYQVEAQITGYGKQAGAFLLESTGEVASLWMPDYRQLTGGKLGYELVQALNEPMGPLLEVFATFAPPEGLVFADDFLAPETTELRPDYPMWVTDLVTRAQLGEPYSEEEFDNFRIWANDEYIPQTDLPRFQQANAEAEATLRSLQGVIDVFVDQESPLSAEALIFATPDGVHAVEEIPFVRTLDLHVLSVGEETLSQARIASGSKAASDAGYEGSGPVAHLDSGINAFTTSDGKGSLTVAGSQSWAPGDTTTTDSSTLASGHGTVAGWVIRGSHPTHRGVATSASLYNAKITNSKSEWNQKGLSGALSKAVGTWNVKATSQSIIDGTTTACPSGGSKGTNTYELTYDYYAHKYNRLHVVSPSNAAGKICPPGSAYNVLTVGSYDDKNAGATRSGFTLATFTPTVKTGDGRKKVDASWPGVGITAYGKNGATTTVSGNSFASPHAAAAGAQLKAAWTGTERKCALLASTSGTITNWQGGWGWATPYTKTAIDVDKMWSSTVAHNAKVGFSSVSIPAGKTLYAFLVWNREMKDTATVDRFSDLDLWINHPPMSEFYTSSSSIDSVEGYTLKNTGSSAKTVSVWSKGWNVPGSTNQAFSLCYDVR